MESVQSSPQSHATKKKAASGKQPLYIRLYFRRHMTELVQLLGYRDVPLDEIEPQLVSLAEQYGQESMDAATEEIMEIVEVRQTFARLKDEARRVARQVLGPPPDSAAAPLAHPPPPASALPATVSEPPEQSTPPDAEGSPLDTVTPPTDEEQYLAAYEAHEGPLYCCDQPNLKWFGEIGDLSVACESCGYVVFAGEEFMPDGEPPGILIDADEAKPANY